MHMSHFLNSPGFVLLVSRVVVYWVGNGEPMVIQGGAFVPNSWEMSHMLYMMMFPRCSVIFPLQTSSRPALPVAVYWLFHLSASIACLTSSVHSHVCVTTGCKWWMLPCIPRLLTYLLQLSYSVFKFDSSSDFSCANLSLALFDQSISKPHGLSGVLVRARKHKGRDAHYGNWPCSIVQSDVSGPRLALGHTGPMMGAIALILNFFLTLWDNCSVFGSGLLSLSQ